MVYELKQIMPAEGWYTKLKADDKGRILYIRLMAFGRFKDMEDNIARMEGISTGTDLKQTGTVFNSEEFDGYVYLPNETRQHFLEYEESTEE